MMARRADGGGNFILWGEFFRVGRIIYNLLAFITSSALET